MQLAGPHRRHALPVGKIGAGQVGGTAQEFGQQFGKSGNGQLRGLAAGHCFRFLVGGRNEFLRLLGKVGRQDAGQAALQFGRFGGKRLGVGIEPGLPFGLQLPPFFLAIPECVDFGGDIEGLVRPVQCRPGRLDFIRTQRRAMNFFGAGGMRRAFADNGATADKRRPLAQCGELLGFDDGRIHCVYIVAVYIAHDVPAIAFEARRGIVAKPVFDAPVDGNAIVVVEDDKFGQLERTRKRAGFVRNAFHKAAVADEGVGVVVDNRMILTVEFLGKQGFGQRHAYGIRQALP